MTKEERKNLIEKLQHILQINIDRMEYTGDASDWAQRRAAIIRDLAITLQILNQNNPPEIKGTT